jgi:hypothetical protein
MITSDFGFGEKLHQIESLQAACIFRFLLPAPSTRNFRTQLLLHTQKKPAKAIFCMACNTGRAGNVPKIRVGTARLPRKKSKTAVFHSEAHFLGI